MASNTAPSTNKRQTKPTTSISVTLRVTNFTAEIGRVFVTDTSRLTHCVRSVRTTVFLLLPRKYTTYYRSPKVVAMK